MTATTNRIQALLLVADKLGRTGEPRERIAGLRWLGITSGADHVVTVTADKRQFQVDLVTRTAMLCVGLYPRLSSGV